MTYIFLISSSLFFLTAVADDAPVTRVEEEKNESHIHTSKKINVLGIEDKTTLFEIVPAVTILDGDKLNKVRAVSLGETLRNEVGVTSTGYGPAASRPIIRGLEGDRIRVLQNGLGVLDVSGTSQDHAVAIDPLLIDSIEIVRGPITLLYGSSAIGGVVNVLTNRTHSEFEAGLHGAIDSQLTSVDNGKALGFKADYGKNNWMYHIDGNVRENQNLKQKDFVRSERLRQRDPLADETRDKLPNSAIESQSGAFGATYVGAKNTLGFAVSTIESDYGVVAEPSVTIDLNQTRAEVIGEFRDFEFVKSIKIKSAQSFYKHRELEDSVVGTTFKNSGNETRLELIQNESSLFGGKHSGVVGVQSNIFNLSAIGDEAFLPETKNHALALFTFQEVNVPDLKLNWGARLENNVSESQVGGSFLTQTKKDFVLSSVAIGSLYKISEPFSIGAQVSFNERAPTYQELFAEGAHIATFTYELGDENLKKEQSLSAEISLRHKGPSTTTVFTVFGQKFNNYISLNPTGFFDDTDESGLAGDSSEDLPIFNYLAQEAEIYGMELDSRWESIIDITQGKTDFYFKGDYLVGKNTTLDSHLPRMTPPRATIGLNHTLHKASLDIEYQRVFEQTKTAANELPTDSYSQVNFGFSYKFNESHEQYTLFARANNVFNVEARNHNSLLKDISQVGGRNYSLGFRAYF